MNPKELKRNYTGSDSFMVQEARLIHGLVSADLARFTAFDSTINAAAQTAYLAAITAAETVVDDTAIVGQLKQSTENMLTDMENAKAKYNEVKYYVMKAFPNSPGTHYEFGINEYDNARKSATKMIQFLDDLSKAAVKYQTQLVASGYSATAITGIATLRTDLLTKSNSQKMVRKQRPKQTEDRVMVLNTCYARMALINGAAQIVYANDYAKQQQFIYMPSSGSSEDITNFNGAVAGGQTIFVGEIAYSEANVFTFSNAGVTSLVFSVSSSNDVEGITVPVAAGATETRTGSELNPDATKVLVKNMDAVIWGNFAVEVEG
jgi:hypothetical protein